MNVFWRKRLCWLLLSTSPLIGHAELPDLGDPSSLTLTPQQEHRLGETIMNQIRHSLEFSSDLWVQNYIQTLGNKLTSNQLHNQFPYTFFVIQDPQINAFALPGGFIGVNTGLILSVSDENELASVLAHESAHVSQHHIARMYDHMHRVQLSTVAGALAAIVIATQNPNAGSGAMAAALAGQQQAMLNFSRDNEREADRVGIQLLAQSGFDPNAMPQFFERLWQSTQYYGQNIPEFLQTHPLTESRIADSRARASQFIFKKKAPNSNFAFIQARIRATGFQSHQEAVSYFEKELSEQKTPLKKDSLLYGLSVAQLNFGYPQQALKAISLLKLQYPQELLIQVSEAEALYTDGKAKEAVAILDKLLKQYPSHQALTLEYNGLLLAQKKSQDVIGNLRRYHLDYGETSDTMRLLSEAYANAGQPAWMHFTQANYLLMTGDYRGALKQLEQAKRDTPPPSKLALQIDARTDEVKSVIEQVEGKPFKE